jgi:hypothetical protein
MIAWLRKFWGWVVAGFAVVVAAVLYLQRRRALTAEAKLRIANAQRQIEVAGVIRRVLETDASEQTEAIAEIDQRIAESERQILAEHESTEGITRDEIRNRLARLGYR